MKTFTFTDPATGQEFSIQAPDGTSFSQAKAVFEQQLGSGKLAGIGIGATLDSATQSLGKLKDIAVSNAVNLADIAKQVPAQIPLGSMNLDQVSASLAQTVKDVGQAATAVSADKGVGQYGISPNSWRPLASSNRARSAHSCRVLIRYSRSWAIPLSGPAKKTWAV